MAGKPAMCRAAFSTFQETILIERRDLLRSGYNALADHARIAVCSAHFACRAVMIGIDAIISRGTVTVLDSTSNALCTIALPATSCTFAPANAVRLTIQPGAIVETQPVPETGWPAIVGLVVVTGLTALKRR
ncbi:MAG TPA: hypothetical protein VJ891_14865, partial [Casimicrobiaceae bacterium]|nr:hypothetical protein [Casimicrobiaceae bacterium]